MIYYFDDCVFDTDLRELRRGGVLYSLEPQVFDLLEFLIRNRERVVSREDVLNTIWGGRIVSEAALDTRLSAARQAIGDNGIEQRLIRTLRTRGFCFVGSVREETRSKTAARIPLESQDRGFLLDQPTIAVVPFINISGDHRQEAIADQITEDLIVGLSRIDWLFVATRASAFACKHQALGTSQMARSLRVHYLLEGTIRQVAGHLRVTVQLVDGIAEHQIWTERYDRDISERFTVQDEICESVVGAVACQLYFFEQLRVQRKSLVSLSNWDCIVRALSLINSRKKHNVVAAHRLLQKIVSAEPESAQIHSLLSMAATLRVHMGWTDRQNAISPALAGARKALALNPDEPWANAALGYALIWKQPEDAILWCQRAVALNPDFAIGHYFLALAAAYAGHGDYVFSHASMAECSAQVDLLARGYIGAANNVRATGSFAIEHYHEGVEFAQSAIQDNPNSPTGYRALVMNLALEGRFDEARRALQILKRLAPEVSQNWIKQNAVWMSDETMKRYVEAFRIAGLK